MLRRSLATQHTNSSFAESVLRLAGAVLVLATVAWSQSTEKVLYKSLVGGNGSLFFDQQSNFYGTENNLTVFGGVYRLHHYLNGTWGFKVLYRFSGSDGAHPQAHPVLDSAGHLYGTTSDGGTNNEGTVFQLTPTPSGFWTEKVLYNFQLGPDGFEPSGGVVLDGGGNLYGTTFLGPHGTIYQLVPNADGTWTHKVLYQFTGGADGSNPLDDLVRDSAGNLYGATFDGGSTGHGTIFELSPESNGTWTFHLVYSLCSRAKCTDGTNGEESATVTPDNHGNLYGTTPHGGHVPCDFYAEGCGVVFKLTHTTTGAWTYQRLHAFCSMAGCLDGSTPVGGVVLDAAGNVYGTTLSGGASRAGTLFRLSHVLGGPWTEDVLYSFCALPDCADGMGPLGNLVLDSAGNLFGTTPSVIFEVTP